MKHLKTIVLGGLVVMAASLSSCNKEDAQVDLTKNVVGVYNGDLTNSNTSAKTSSTATITRYNDYTVQVHCVSTDFDSTFLLELYENGDMMKVCSTGDAYYNEYGHEKSNKDHMMGSGNMMNWSEHMGDHDGNDEHYGDFDVSNNQFDYTMKIEHSTVNEYEQFVGSK
jgi:hypothetical protein